MTQEPQTGGLRLSGTEVALPHRQDRLQVSGLLQAGTITALMGPSGCGKSSFLNALALISELEPNQSEKFKSSLQLDEQTASGQDASNWNCSLVFQQSSLFEHMSVLENLCFPLRFHAPWKDWSSTLKEQHALKLLSQWGLEALKNKSVSQLSGGEAQRLSLLRGVIHERKILLLDESLSSIDKSNKSHIKERLRAHVREHQVSCLFVTHSDEDCQDFVDKVVKWPADLGTGLEL